MLKISLKKTDGGDFALLLEGDHDLVIIATQALKMSVSADDISDDGDFIVVSARASFYLNAALCGIEDRLDAEITWQPGQISGKRKAAAFCRVPVSGAPSYSKQLNRCYDAALSYGYRIARIVSADADDADDKLDDLLRLAESGEYQALVVAAPEILADDRAERAAIECRCTGAGVELLVGR